VFVGKLPTAALVAIGDELLNGDVRDVNIYRLSQGLTRLGIRVTEARLIRDEHSEIYTAVRDFLLRVPDVLVISGGLGPTEDDRTLAAVADAMRVSLVEHAEARRLVEAQYARLLDGGHVSMRGPERVRRKMARLPEGATPLPNSRGTAPGVALVHGATWIYCLPGVPAELDAIFTEKLLPDLRAHLDLGAWIEVELVVACQDEAAVAAPLREVAPRHPDVYLKSLARSFPEAQDGELRILAAAHAPDEAMARSRAEDALRDLRQQLEAAGLSVFSDVTESKNQPKGEPS